MNAGKQPFITEQQKTDHDMPQLDITVFCTMVLLSQDFV